MAETPSNMIELGTVAPDFSLLDVCSNQFIDLRAIQSSTATVIMFICNHCPYVKHIQAQLVAVSKKYIQKNIAFVAISANDAAKYPTDGPDFMRLEAQKAGYPFPYLYDESQATAKAYQAACTPDFYVFDSHLKCVYRGRFDNSTPGNHHPVTGVDLTSTLDNILNNQPISNTQYPSLGCNIKWK